MFIFGHLGITLGVFFIIGRLAPSMRGRINYFYVAFGAVLPDIIDKPVGRMLFAYSIASGYLIAHTLIFSLLLALTGFCIFRRSRDTRVLLVSVASLFHLVQDRMWTKPINLLWPLFGWKFPSGNPEDWLNYFLVMFSKSFAPGFSYVFISEAIGFIIMVLFILRYLFSRAKANQ